MNEIEIGSLWLYKSADPEHPDHYSVATYYRAQVTKVVYEIVGGEYPTIYYTFLDDEGNFLTEEYFGAIEYVYDSMLSNEFLEAYELIKTPIEISDYIL